jgi:uncharacterized ParB-like nuclease family protein
MILKKNEQARQLAQMLKADNLFSPCPVDSRDEIFPNGIFEFNITKIINHIQRNPDSIPLEKVVVNDYYTGFSSVNESYMEHVEISRPIILAEISPGRYNVIDGNHRLEKAHRMGIKTIQAHRLNVKQHIKFLISKRAYTISIEYWNSKLK